MKQIICDLCKRKCDDEHTVELPSGDVCGECVEAIVAKAIPHCYHCANCGRFVAVETHAADCNWVWGREQANERKP